MFKWIAVWLLPFMMGCTLLTAKIEDMDDHQFDILKKEVYLLTKYGCKKVTQNDPTAAIKLQEYIKYIKPHIDQIDEHSQVVISEFISLFTENIKDPDLQLAVELALLEIERAGGFSFIETNVGQVLTPRSLGLATSLIQGLIDGCQTPKYM